MKIWAGLSPVGTVCSFHVLLEPLLQPGVREVWAGVEVSDTEAQVLSSVPGTQLASGITAMRKPDLFHTSSSASHEK